MYQNTRENCNCGDGRPDGQVPRTVRRPARTEVNNLRAINPSAK